MAAGTLLLPNGFVNGTPGDADPVNANFDAVENSVNDNDVRITTAQHSADETRAGHGVNTNTQLTEFQVDAFVSNNGDGLATELEGAGRLGVYHFLGALEFERLRGAFGLAFPGHLGASERFGGAGGATVASAAPAEPASGANPTGQATVCGASPCDDTGSAAVVGPTAMAYTSASTVSANPANLGGSDEGR